SRPLLQTGYYADPQLSPDGSKLAFAKKDSLTSTYDIWILDLASGTPRRLTFDPANEVSPIWSPDGGMIIFSSDRKRGGYSLYRKNSNGNGDEEMLMSSDNQRAAAYQWSPDGRFITFAGDSRAFDISMLNLADRKTSVLVHTSANKMHGTVSP